MGNRLSTILFILGSCQSITTSTSHDTSMGVEKSANISLLANLIVDYHRLNFYWPDDGLDLLHFYDSAKFVLTNFDTLSFQSESNWTIVEYRLIKNPSSPGTIRFVARDEADSVKSQIEWCHRIHENTSSNFGGQLLFKYENGNYKCD